MELLYEVSLLIKRKCIQCGKEFFLSDSEIDFYNKKNLNLPKRCKDCRNANKHINSDTYSGGQADTEPKNIIISKGIGALIIFAVLAVLFLIISTSQNLKLNEIFFNSSNSNEEVFTESSYSDTISSASTEIEISITNEPAYTNAVTSVPAEIEISETNRQASSDTQSIDKAVKFTFRNEQALNEHYQKHGIAMGFSSAQEYEEAAGNVVTSSDSLHKTEKEDGDDIYYNESTNEFVIISTDGYIRTYFYPDDGKEYFDRQ